MGGYLLPSSGRGPAPGTGGRPKSVLRERLHDTLESRVPVIQQIADGEVIHKIRIRIADFLPYVTLVCANCGEDQVTGTLTDPAASQYRTIESMQSATPRDRLAALDMAGKYGAGVVRQISVDDVRGRVEATVAALRAVIPMEYLEQVLPSLREIWST